MDRTSNIKLWVLLAGSMAAACSGGGGGGGGSSSTTFQVSGLSIREGAVWPINGEISLTFTEPVDFATVSANTINIRSLSSVPATGAFRMAPGDDHTVLFQPTCPTKDDLSDAGLIPGQTYVLRLPGLDSASNSSNTVRSTTGTPLGIQQIRTFSTPNSTLPSIAFLDRLPGSAPQPVLGLGDDATYIELGGDPGNRVLFLPDDSDPDTDPELSDPDFQVPLNLYSDHASRVAIVIAFNQPVNPSATNISSNRLRLEFQNSLGDWKKIDTRVSLIENCTETGARVRLEPIGVLPPASRFRAVVLAGFQDIVGEASSLAQVNFAIAPTEPVEFQPPLDGSAKSDAFHETYDFSGDSPQSFEDTQAVFETPVAAWGKEGKLTAGFSFDGDGGPNGDFDWVVRTGDLFFFDTTNTSITGGPGGIPTTTQVAANGVVNVRNLTIEADGEIRVQGPNPMRINATGEIRIDGRLDISGFAAKDVATLNTGNQVEIGGAGCAGGGKGGNANDNITGPTPRGGNGFGPFRQAGLGGQGGEMGFNPQQSKDARRPGGGGGGRFAKDWLDVTTFAPVGGTEDLLNPNKLAPSPGNNGNPVSFGADFAARGLSTPEQPSKGGNPGLGAFVDLSDDNDFFGIRPVTDGTGTLIGLVRGELSRLWAGYGGGGGGNAGQRFPNPSWNFNSDEKGGGGGGGGGGLYIKALGRIVFGQDGQILSNGARGGTGENTNFLDHIGGTGGGGSGGHVILESAALVDFSDGGNNVTLKDFVLAAGPVKKTGSLGDVNACCKTQSNGGAGGPGVIQIHVPNPRALPSDDPGADIVVPSDALTYQNIIDAVTSPPAYVLVPTFGKQSKARSKWISIGGADQKPADQCPGSPTPCEGLVRFLFDGLDSSGKIRTNGFTASDLTPLVTSNALCLENYSPADPCVRDNSANCTTSNARITGDFTVELSGSVLDDIRAGNTSNISNDIYLRTPALLEGFALRLFVAAAPQDFEDFSIAAATYDEGDSAAGDEVLHIQVESERGPLANFVCEHGAPGFKLMPRFFQVSTGGLPNALPDSAFVQIRFEAAADNGFGAPDEANLLMSTSDISEFNNIAPGLLQFFRYEVAFDLDAQNQGVNQDTEAVSLEFLKIPFVF